MRLILLARRQASTASRLCSCSRASCSRMRIGRRMLRPPGGIGKSVGVTMLTRSKRRRRRRRFDRVVDAFQRRPTRRRSGCSAQPSARSREPPARPPGRGSASSRRRKRIRTGARWSRIRPYGRRPSARARRRAARCPRDWRGGTRRRCGRRPAPCRTTCRTRRRTCPSPRISACCAPQIAVAARSSLRPGSKWMSFLAVKGRGAQELLSSPPTGEPR